MKTKLPMFGLALIAIAALLPMECARAVDLSSGGYTNNFYNAPNFDIPPYPDLDFSTSISGNYATNNWQIVTNDPAVEMPWDTTLWLPDDGCVQGFASFICENPSSEYSCALVDVGSQLAAPQAFVISSDFKIPIFEAAREGYIGLAAFGNHANLGAVGGGYGSFIWGELQLSTTLHNGTGSTSLVDFENGSGGSSGITLGNQVGAALPMNTNDTYNLTMTVTYDYNTNMYVTLVSSDVSQQLTNSRSEIINYNVATNYFLSTATLPGNGNYFGYCDRQDPNGKGGPGPYETNVTVHANFFISLAMNPPSGPPQPITATIAPRPNLYVGANATLNASFSGVTPFSYKWQYGGTNLSFTNDISTFSTSASLGLTSVQLTNAGYYRCYATNTLGSNSTAWVAMTVFSVPANPLINVQITDAGGPQYFHQGPAVLGNAADVWNVLNTWTNAMANANIVLFDSTGAATPVQISYTPGVANYVNSSAVIPLFDQYLQGTSTSNTMVTLSGLQPGTAYNLVVYAIGGAYQGGVVSGAVTGTCVGGAGLVSDVGGYTNGVNYVQNQFATSDGSGNLTFALAPLASTTYSAWNGLQITKSSALPSVALQAVAGGQLQVTWSGGQGMLLQSTNVAGPWTTNSNPSPYTFTPTGGQEFFRTQ